MNAKKFALGAMFAVLFAAQSSYAIIGAGFHWGFDFSHSMNSVNDSLSISVPVSVGTVDGNIDGTISVSRSGFERHWLNFGGKLYWDLIPVIPIDAIELSLNFGVWQYDSELHINVPESAPLVPADINHTIDLTLKGNDQSYFGLDGMPYANLRLDFTLRRQLLNLAVVKFDAGLGYSLYMGTPIISASFIENALSAEQIASLATDSPDSRIGRDIIDAMLDETLGSTAHGMHFLLGVRAKLPVFPIGLYGDVKYMLPFSDSISDAKKGVNASGVLINLGISLSI